MATEGSFLYEIKLDLNAGNAAQQFSGVMGQVQSRVQQLRNQMQGMENRFTGLANTGPGATQTLSPGRKQLQQTDKSLRELLQKGAKLESTFDNISLANLDEQIELVGQGVGKVNDRVEDLGAEFPGVASRVEQLTAEVVQTDNALENLEGSGGIASLRTATLQAADGQDQLQKEIVQTSNAQEELNKTSRGYRDMTRKTTQTSQNLLRIMQDSQFGMMGMANNIQALGESLGRAGTRGKTAFAQLKGGIKNLFLGPMALPALITAVTLLAQNYTALKEAGVDALNALGFEMQALSQETRDFRDQITKTFKEAEESAKEARASDFAEFVRQLEGGAEVTAILARRFGRVSAVVSRFDNKLQSLTEAETQDIATRTSAIEVLSKQNDFRQQAADAMDMSLQKIQALREEQNRLRTVLESVGAANVEEARVRQRLTEMYGVQGEELDKLTNAYMRFREEQEEAEKQLKFERRLRELQIESMEEGLQKEIASINFSIKKRKQKIRQLGLEAEKQDQLLQLITEIGQQQRQSARSEAQDSFLKPLGDQDLMLNPFGPGFIKAEAFTNNAQENFEATMAEIRFRQQQMQIDTPGGQGAEGGIGFLEAAVTGGQPDMQDRIDRIANKEEIAQDRLNARLQRIRDKTGVEPGEDLNIDQKQQLSQKEIHLWENKEKKKSQITEKYAQRRQKVENDTARKRFDIISQAAQQITGKLSQTASSYFNTWLSQRQQDLKNTEKTEKERRKILKKEGKKRFKFMKAMKITSASVSGISAAINAYESGTRLPAPAPIPHIVGLSMAGASLAATSAKINKIASMSIGDKLSGGGTSGGGSRGGSFTQRAAATSATTALDKGTGAMQRRRTGEDQIKKTAERVGKEVANQMPDEVTMGRDTAAAAQEVANARDRQVNK